MALLGKQQPSLDVVVTTAAVVDLTFPHTNRSAPALLDPSNLYPILCYCYFRIRALSLVQSSSSCTPPVPVSLLFFAMHNKTICWLALFSNIHYNRRCGQNMGDSLGEIVCTDSNAGPPPLRLLLLLCVEGM